jgi:hypothetical protein
MLFDNSGVVNIKKNDLITTHLNNLITAGIEHNMIDITGSLLHDNLYHPHVNSLCSTLPSSPSTVNVDDSSSIQPVSASRTTYFTTELTTHSELVRFFHESWNHASESQMCQIVQNQTFDNIPSLLTIDRIHKYFPNCAACAMGTLSQLPVPTISTTSSSDSLLPNECKLHVDINVFDTKSFDGSKGALTILDDFSNHIWGYSLDNYNNLHDYLEEVRQEICNVQRKVKIIKLDNQFITKNFQKWARKNNITLEPCIPHEHHQIGKIERMHRTITDSIRKYIHSKPHLSPQYWSMCFHDVIMKLNLMPNSNLEGKSPREYIYNQRIDLNNYPILPFGTVVMAHIPLNEQTKLGPRAVKHYAVGTSLLHYQGIKLFNPETKRIIIRRTFKTIGSNNPLSIPDYFQCYLTPDNQLISEETSTDVTINEDTPVDDVNKYKYLINTIHKDDDDDKLYKVTRLGIIDHNNHDIIVAYRKRLGKKLKNGYRLLRSADDDVPYHIADIVRLYNKSLHDNSIPDQQSVFSALSSTRKQSKISSTINKNLFRMVSLYLQHNYLTFLMDQINKDSSML